MRRPLNSRGLSKKQKGKLLKGGFQILADLENNRQEYNKRNPETPATQIEVASNIYELYKSFTDDENNIQGLQLSVNEELDEYQVKIS